MKRLIIAAAVVVLTLPALSAGASNYTGAFAAGNYTGTITSVIPAINGQTAKMEIKQVGNKVIGTVEFAGSKEVWMWDDTKLDQQEIDTKTNTTAMTYGATATGTPNGVKQTYNISCKDKANNVCDAGADSRNYWILEAKPNKITYTVFGVDPTKRDDKTLTPTKRHEFVFNKAN